MTSHPDGWKGERKARIDLHSQPPDPPWARETSRQSNRLYSRQVFSNFEVSQSITCSLFSITKSENGNVEKKGGEDQKHEEKGHWRGGEDHANTHL